MDTIKKGTVVLASEEVEYSLVRSSRRTVALYIRPGGELVIRAPWYVPAYILKQFIESKARWIIRHRDKIKNNSSVRTETSYVNGGTTPFLGKNLTIRAIEDNRNRVFSENDELIIRGPDINLPGRITALTEKWYLEESVRYFKVRTEELAAANSTLLPQPLSVSVRKMKSRWGTCKNNGAIWFNRELIKKEPELVDYVIIHELCHLVHHNHGKEFYVLLENIVPDFREKRKRLRSM